MTFKNNFNYQKTFPKDFKSKQRFHSKANWWTPVWNGLLSAKHYKTMRSSLWLYLYFLVHANRYSGILFRKTSTIAEDMQLNQRTVSRLLKILKQNGYIEIRQTGHALEIAITKWKSIKK
ncbi:MAG: helix-turn-helix domain-containing protein [Pyrinomonadaceae bacterium]